MLMIGFGIASCSPVSGHALLLESGNGGRYIKLSLLPPEQGKDLSPARLELPLPGRGTTRTGEAVVMMRQALLSEESTC